MAMSVELLSFYCTLFEHSHNAINALAAALSTYYRSCTEILIQHCPACFGGISFGRSLDKGGDIHVAMDGNFHHRHQHSAGDSPSFMNHLTVDAIRWHIAWAHQHPLKRSQSMKQKASTDGFDDTGLMALICWHDIPLFFTNIDTPSEQQKYSITLIDYLFSLLPPQANVVVLYDVGCVLSCSLSWFNIFDQVIMSCLHFTTTAMHAYSHEWACQLVYNPCLISGLGSSNGEGTEHLWSHFIKLIGIERVSSVSP
ncbi:hypothetical protein EDC04DRAFT_2871207 [Pisolithus marmoratus]|nr:hypothetical protein EDC04DRAFT_2871207 [Pisolithus marmoratus]